MTISINESPSPENLPQQPQSTREDVFIDVDFGEWVVKLAQEIDEDNKDEELQRVRKWVKNERFYRGQQRGFFSPVTGTYQPINLDDYSTTEQSILLINNQVRPKVKAIAKEWSKSQSRLHSISTKDNSLTKRASRYVDGALQIFQRKLIDESFKQRESKNAILCGNYFRYTYWSLEKSSYIEEPVFEAEEFSLGENHWECQSCQEVGESQEELNEGRCPVCDSEEIAEKEPKNFSVNKQKGTKPVNIGQPVTESVHPIEIKVHLRARSIRQSPYLRRKRLIMKQILKYTYPYANIRKGEISPVSHYSAELESSVGNNNSGAGSYLGKSYADTSNGMTEVVEFVQIWLDRPMYFNVRLSKDITLGDGRVIPYGTKLIEAFPNGLYLALSGQELLDLKGENKSDYWTHSSYDILASSFWGDGIEDSIQSQQLINEIQSLMVENILHNASPKIIFNPHLIDHELLTGRPREMTPMSLTARKDDNPKNAIMQIAGMNLTGEAQNSIMQSKDDMREQMGAFPTMQGMSDPHIQTATGMAIVRDSALGLLAPVLALKAQMEVEWAYQVLKLLQLHWVDGQQQFSGILGKYSVAEAQAFSQINLEQDIEIIAEPSSWMPRTDLEVRQDFINFLTAGGLPLGFLNPEIPVEVRERASELFRFGIDFDKIQPDIRWANLRVEQLEETVIRLISSGYVKPEEESTEVLKVITSEIPIDLYIDDHQVYIDQYKKFLKTDKGIYSSPLLKSAVRYLILQHEDAMRQLKEEAMDAQLEDNANMAVQQGAMAKVADSEQGQQQPMDDGSSNPNLVVSGAVGEGATSEDSDTQNGTGRQVVTPPPTSNSNKVAEKDIRK